MAENRDHSVEAVSGHLSQHIRAFISQAITASRCDDGTLLHLEARVDGRNGDHVAPKRWSKSFDISRLTAQIVSPPLSPLVRPQNSDQASSANQSSTGADEEQAPVGAAEPTEPGSITAPTAEPTEPRALAIAETRQQVPAPTTGSAQTRTLASSETAQQFIAPVAKPAQITTLASTETVQQNTGSGKRPAVADEDDSQSFPEKRRQHCSGGLRLAKQSISIPVPAEDSSSARQLENSETSVPQRKKRKDTTQPQMQPSTLDKLIIGIWENLYKRNNSKAMLDPDELSSMLDGTHRLERLDRTSMPASQFQNINQLCYRVTRTSSYFRGLELLIQAHWIDCFDARVVALTQDQPDVGSSSHKKAALLEACRVFGWTEKELRNRMAIWRGYSELKDVAGWSSLIFSGAGIYRFCKYRIGFDSNSLAKLGRLRWRFEVAADTMHPTWRKMLNIIGIQSRRIYHGHPLDWVVSRTTDPVPLNITYRQWDRDFKFEFIEESILDTSVWGDHDPRRIQESGPFICQTCHLLQSGDPQENQCQCFPELFGLNRQSQPPVQVFATEDGRNNGLLACCDFPRGTPIGEFVGLLTSNLTSVDVMTSTVLNPAAIIHYHNNNPPSSTKPSYQILPHPRGNHLRFINHACSTTSHLAHTSSASSSTSNSTSSSAKMLPNSQYQKFTWLGLERIILVSKGGITAGTEILVDYGERYWKGLEKQCLCGGGGSGRLQ